MTKDKRDENELKPDKTKDSKKLFSKHGSWYYEMQNLGYNYRLPDIQCALGISQLKRATFNIEKSSVVPKCAVVALGGTVSATGVLSV